MITTKPIIYLVNLSKKNFIAKKSKWLPRIADWVTSHGGGTVIPFSVEYEEEVFGAFQAGGAAAKQEVIAAHQGTKSVLPRIIKCGYKELNLIYFFTAGEKEVRAWNIYNGSLAPQAAEPSIRILREASSRPSSAPTTMRSTAAARRPWPISSVGQVPPGGQELRHEG